MASRRDTTTGDVMEQMVQLALAHGQYKCERGKTVGTRLGVGRHKIDTYAEDQRGRVHLISLKWQQVGGTAEQKIPFEVISLIDLLLKDESYYKAHLVLGGDGWRYKDFYVNGGLKPFIRNADRVNITTLDAFVGAANRGLL